MQNHETSQATRDEIARVWQRWGIPIVSIRRSYDLGDVEGLALRDAKGELLALITWHVDERTAEITSVDALETGRGHGSKLLALTEGLLTDRGIERVTLVTTNDNLRALQFYTLRGYRLVGVHLDAMDEVRRVKPDLPERGEHDIPLTDMWVLEKRLPSPTSFLQMGSRWPW